MAEYIDRDAAIAACFDGFADCRDDCAANIRSIPAADVVERKTLPEDVEELVKALREHAKPDGWDCSVCMCRDAQNRGFFTCTEELAAKAADAIEELSKKRVGTWHRVKASQRSYSFVCNSCGSMYPYLTRCCPNCGVEYIDEEPQKEESK